MGESIGIDPGLGTDVSFSMGESIGIDPAIATIVDFTGVVSTADIGFGASSAAPAPSRPFPASLLGGTGLDPGPSPIPRLNGSRFRPPLTLLDPPLPLANGVTIPASLSFDTVLVVTGCLLSFALEYGLWNDEMDIFSYLLGVDVSSISAGRALSVLPSLTEHMYLLRATSFSCESSIISGDKSRLLLLLRIISVSIRTLLLGCFLLNSFLLRA